MPSKLRRTVVLALALLAGVVTVIVLAFPLWFPWALRPLLTHYGISYGGYQRAGLAHLVLHDVHYEKDGWRFQSRSVVAYLPIEWVWHQSVLPTTNHLVLFKQWTLSPVPPEGTNPRRGNSASASTNSFVGILREASTNVAFLAKWAPRIALQDGAVQINANTITIPSIIWNRGDVQIQAAFPRLKSQAALEAHLGRSFPWRASIQFRPSEVELAVNLQTNVSGASVSGSMTWETNQLNLTADFDRTGLIPARASAACPSFRVPAPLLHLPAYADLTGQLAAEWTRPDFRVRFLAEAHPIEARKSWPTMQARLQVHGDTNALTVDQAAVETPFLEVSLSENTHLSLKGELLDREARLNLAANLSRQTWFPATGTASGVVRLERGPTRIPIAHFEVVGQALSARAVRVQKLKASGSVEWPWLTLDAVRLAFDGGASAALAAKLDLEHRLIANGIFHVQGRVPVPGLPSSMDFQSLQLQANVRGPFSQLAHEGAVTVQQLVAGPAFVPIDVSASWHGQQTHLNSLRARISGGGSVAEVSGSLEAEMDDFVAEVERFTLTQGGQILYRLANSFVLALDRTPLRGTTDQIWKARLTPIRLEGPAGNLACEANVTWPAAGVIRALASGLRCSVANPFLRQPLPDVRLDHFQVAAGWTNGPAVFDLAGAGQYTTNGWPIISARFAGHGDARGLALRELVVASGGHSVVSGNGLLPVRIIPGSRERILDWDPDREMALHASSVPNRVFWDEIAKRAHLRLTDPAVQVDVAGFGTALEGRITARIGALHPYLQLTNWTVPNVDQLEAEILFSKRSIRVDPIRFRVEGQPVQIIGRIPLAAKLTTGWNKLLDFAESTGTLTVASARLAAFAPLAPKFIAPQGRITAQLALRPNLQFGGEVDLRGAATRPLSSLGTIEDVNTRLILEGRQVRLQTFTGLIGGEPFLVTGSVGFENWHGRRQWPRVSLKARGEDVPLARQPELILRSDFNLSITNAPERAPVVSGLVQLRDSVVLSDLQDLIPSHAARPEQRPPYFSIEAEPFAQCRLELQVKGDKFLKVRSPFFKGQVSANLRLEGTLHQPVALGDVTINSGTVQFPFATLDVTQGVISLNSANPYQPQVLVTATTRSFGYDVRMEVTGTADSPTVQFSSTPPLTPEQIIVMLSTGELPQAGSTASAQQRAGRLALFFGKNLLSEFGSGTGAADRLTVRSGEYISEQGQQTYSLEYRLTKHWSLVGEYDRFGDVNAGLKWHIYSH